MKGRNLLMIPGPIEFEPEVLQAMGAPTTSHVAPDFMEVFGRVIEQMREVFLAPSGQPFVLAGTGTLGMDAAAANLIEPGDKALVLNTGYFSDRFAAILERYGADVDQVCASVGDTVDPEAVHKALDTKAYKLMTITHVDTSTGVAVDVEPLAAMGRERDALVVLDGVCSVAGEELQQEEWGIDVVLTASQKAIGVPPGLALLVVSPKAMDAWRARNTPVQNYYADFTSWLPIMEAYEARRPGYFATPAVNLVVALEKSLSLILAEGMPARFKRHRRLKDAAQAALLALELEQVPMNPGLAATTLTAPYYPEGIDGGEMLKRVKEQGVILAGGLHPEIRSKYFRIGHMGPTRHGDLLQTIGAVEYALYSLGYYFNPGAGLAGAEASLFAENE